MASTPPVRAPRSVPATPRNVPHSTPRSFQPSPRLAGALHRLEDEPARVRTERTQIHRTVPPQRGGRLDPKTPTTSQHAMLRPRTLDRQTESSSGQVAMPSEQMRLDLKTPMTSQHAMLRPRTPDRQTESSSGQVAMPSEQMRAWEGTSSASSKPTPSPRSVNRRLLAVKHSPRDRDLSLQRAHQCCVKLATALRAEEFRCHEETLQVAALPRAPERTPAADEYQAQIRQQQEDIAFLVRELERAQQQQHQKLRSSHQAVSQVVKRGEGYSKDCRAPQHSAGDVRRQDRLPHSAGAQKPRMSKPSGRTSTTDDRELGLAGGKASMQRVSSAPVGAARARAVPLMAELDRAQRAGACRGSTTGQPGAPDVAAEASEGAAPPAAEGGHDQLEQGDDDRHLRYEVENDDLRRQLQQLQDQARRAEDEKLELNLLISELQHAQAESSAEPPADIGCEAEGLRAPMTHSLRNERRRAATFDSSLPRGFVQTNLGLPEGRTEGPRLSELIQRTQPAATGSAPCADAAPEAHQLSERSAMQSRATLEEQAATIVALGEEAVRMKWKLEYLESSAAAMASGLGSGTGPRSRGSTHAKGRSSDTRTRASSSLLASNPTVSSLDLVRNRTMSTVRGSLEPVRDRTMSTPRGSLATTSTAHGGAEPVRDRNMSTASASSVLVPEEVRRQNAQSLDPAATRSNQSSLLRLESCLQSEREQAALAAREETAELKLKLAGYEALQRSLPVGGADVSILTPTETCQALQAQIDSEAAHYKRTMNEEVAQCQRSSAKIALLEEEAYLLSQRLFRKKQRSEARKSRDSRRFSTRSSFTGPSTSSFAAAAPGAEADTESTMPVEGAPPGASPLGVGHSSQVATDGLVRRRSVEEECREEVASLRAECAELMVAQAESEESAMVGMARTRIFTSHQGGARDSSMSHRMNRTVSDMSVGFDLTPVSAEEALHQQILDLTKRNSELENEVVLARRSVDLARQSTVSAQGNWNTGVTENRETANGPRPTYIFDGNHFDLTSLRAQVWQERHLDPVSSASSVLSEESAEDGNQEDSFQSY